MSKDHEENRNFDLSKLDDSIKQEFDSYDKRNRNNRVNRGCRSSIELETTKNGRKKIYQSNCGYDLHSQRDFPDCRGNTGKGKVMNRKKKRPVQIWVPKNNNKYDNKTNIPEELVIEILSRLPLKSRARFKCVSSQWKHLILNVVPKTKFPHKLMILSQCETQSYSFRFLDNKGDVENVRRPRKRRIDQVEAQSSCHGLLLIQIDYDLFVWNPVTAFFRKVLSLYGIHNYNCGQSDFRAGLFFCSATNKYKVVLQVRCWDISWDSKEFFVATFGDHSWKRINIYFDNLFLGPIFKGYRHWFSRCDASIFHDSILPRNDIYYFDSSIDNFIEVAKPQAKKDNRDIFLSLGVLDECLCITRHDPTNCEGNIELLVMKEYGNGNSWEIMFVFSKSPGLSGFEPLFITKEDEVWVKVEMYFQSWIIKAYDVHGNFLRDVWAPPKNELCQILLFVESWDVKHV